MLLLHFNSIKSRKILKFLKESNIDVIEYNPYNEYITTNKIKEYKTCNSLIISGSNPKLKTIEMPQIETDPFGKSFYSRVEQVIDLFQGSSKKILGICYGSQLLWHYYGGVTDYHQNLYGKRIGEHNKTIKIMKPVDKLFTRLPSNNSFNFYRNILLYPQSDIDKRVRIIGTDETIYNNKKYNNISAFRVNGSRIWGVIFHPESSLRGGGVRVFTNFLNA